MIETKQVRYRVRGREILRGIDFHVEKGEFVGLIGPNGSGKSTFLKNIYKVLHPQSGDIFLMGGDLLAMSNREMAQRLAVMAQEQEAAFDFTVEEVVMMGRQARKRLLETESQEDRALVTQVLERTQLTPLREQGFSTLSGGEKQRVLMARALAQQNLAAAYCHRLYALKNGVIVGEGTPRELLTPAFLQEVYEVEAEVLTGRDGTLRVFFCSQGEGACGSSQATPKNSV